MNHTITSAIALAALSLGLGCSSSDSGGGGGGTDTGVASDTGGGGGDTGSGGGDTGGGGGDAPAALSCDAYCALNVATCKDAQAQYVDVATCKAMCAKMTPGTKGATSGDTLGCRDYHTNAAAGTAGAAGDPATHCPHSGAYGASVCGDSRCADFCALALAQCPSPKGPYADLAACMTGCAAAPFDATKKELEPSAAPGKLNCLEYHLQAAYLDPATHCGHITVASGPCKTP